MSAVAFDTLKLARKLRDTAQMTQVQAEGVADALAEAMSGAELATKSDIREIELRINNRLDQIDGRLEAVNERMDSRLEAVNERIERRAAETEGRLIKWLIGIGATSILSIGGMLAGAVWAIIRYLPPGSTPGH